MGYPLYLTLLGGTISGTGVGVLMPFRNIRSLSEVLPSIQRKLTLAGLILFFIFTAVISFRMMLSDFILEGY